MKSHKWGCAYCFREFDNFREKLSHNCRGMPEEDITCMESDCIRSPEPDSDYCALCKPKPADIVMPDRVVEEFEIPIWDVTVYYEFRLSGRTAAPNKDEAMQKLEEEHDPHMTDRIHKDIEQIGTKTVKEDKGFEEDPPNFKTLDEVFG